MKSKIILTLLLLISISVSLIAQELSGVPAAFVDVGFGARPLGMGGAFVGLANDVHSVVWNPAGLAKTEGREATFAVQNHYKLIKYNFLGYSMPFKSGVEGLGFAFIYTGDEALSEMTLQAAYAREVLKGLSVGASLKYRRASFGNNSINASDYILFEPDEIQEGMLNQVKGSANGIGFDIGALYRLNDKIMLGLMLKDIYSPVFWDSKVDNPDKKAKGSYSEVVPFETTIGSSFRVIDELLISADYSPAFVDDVDNKIRGGIELRLFKILYTRMGIQNNINNVRDEKFMLGIGLNIGFFKGSRLLIDYSNVSEEISSTSRISVGFEF